MERAPGRCVWTRVSGGALGGLGTPRGSCARKLQRLVWRLLVPREARVEAPRRSLCGCGAPPAGPALACTVGWRLTFWGFLGSEGPSVTSGSLCALTAGQLQAALAPKTQGPQPGTRSWECGAPLTTPV